MNEFYAIDPACTSDANQLQHLLDKFGFATGRFIARYPYHWRSMVIERFEGLGDIAKERLKRRLQLAEQASIDVDHDYSPSRSWYENAVITLVARQKVESLILEEDRPPNGVSVDHVLYDHECYLRDARGAHVDRTPESYAHCIWPLLLSSKEIYVVDRYFRLRYLPKDGSPPRIDFRRRAVLRKFLQAAHRSRRCKTIIVFADKTEVLKHGGNKEEWLNDLTHIQKVSDTNAVTLTGDLLDKEDIDHGRYVFSSKAGLQFDWGFDCVRDPRNDKNHVHWLSPGELDPIYDKYARRWPP